jgi:hypothetical protein
MKSQGRGRRCKGRGLVLAAVLLLATTALAAEDPDAPSATRASTLRNAAALNTAPASAFDLNEWTMVSPVIAPGVERKKVIDKKFLALTGIATGLTIADFEMTQRCLGKRTCVEADPLMPTSRAGMYASSAPVNVALYYWSYRMKAKGKRLWWLPTAAAIASHAVGVGTNIRFLK